MTMPDHDHHRSCGHGHCHGHYRYHVIAHLVLIACFWVVATTFIMFIPIQIVIMAPVTMVILTAAISISVYATGIVTMAGSSNSNSNIVTVLQGDSATPQS